MQERLPALQDLSLEQIRDGCEGWLGLIESGQLTVERPEEHRFHAALHAIVATLDVADRVRGQFEPLDSEHVDADENGHSV